MSFPRKGSVPPQLAVFGENVVQFNIHEEEHDSPLHGFAHLLDFQPASVQLPSENMFGLILGLSIVLRHKPFSKQAQPSPQHVDSVAEGLHGASSGE